MDEWMDGWRVQQEQYISIHPSTDMTSSKILFITLNICKIEPFSFQGPFLPETFKFTVLEIDFAIVVYSAVLVDVDHKSSTLQCCKI
jgi:hypothetical protein